MVLAVKGSIATRFSSAITRFKMKELSHLFLVKLKRMVMLPQYETVKLLQLECVGHYKTTNGFYFSLRI